MNWWQTLQQAARRRAADDPPLKWFFALNQSSRNFDQYAELAKVAVHTAQRHTRLQAHFLYDGEPNALTAWMERRGVRVLACRSVFHAELAAIARDKQRPLALSIGSGALLRLEIPRLTQALHINDRFVLYTDVDVMFTGACEAALQRMRPRYFAVAPEGFDIKFPEAINSGVMLMNLPALRRVDADFHRFIRANFDDISQYYDQRAYKRFFGRETQGRARWDSLPMEYNWKPYWGDNDAARIIHFHGAKPGHRAQLRAGTANAVVKRHASGAFDAYCARWDQALSEIKADAS